MITQVRVLPSLLPGERSLKRSTDQSTGADSQRNAERIGNIPLRKESKSGIAVVAKWKTLEDLVLPILKTRRARRGLDGTLGNVGSSPTYRLKIYGVRSPKYFQSSKGEIMKLHNLTRLMNDHGTNPRVKVYKSTDMGAMLIYEGHPDSADDDINSSRSIVLPSSERAY